jgi:hypothetical protein
METICKHRLAACASERDGSGIHTVPAKMPAAPTPESALPNMNTAELGAPPQMAEPTSKIRMLERRTSFTEYSVYILPNSS